MKVFILAALCLAAHAVDPPQVVFMHLADDFGQSDGHRVKKKGVNVH